MIKPGQNKKEFNCKNCGQPYHPWYNTDNKYCSYGCSALGRRGGNLAHDGVKKCCMCLETLPISEFHKTPRQVDGFHGRCRNCDKTVKLKSRYGITLDEYREIMIECNICGSKRNLHLDHDHVSNKLRGCLCINCNTALGGFRDNTELLKNAIDYLEKDRV